MDEGDEPEHDPLADPRVFGALQAYQAEIEAGRCPDRAEFVARYPEVAEALAGCLLALDFVRSGPPVARPVESRLGDFRLLREIGRGGMGAVHEAEQLS